MKPYSVLQIALPLPTGRLPVLSADVTVLTATTTGQSVALPAATVGKSLKVLNVGADAITVDLATSVEPINGAANFSLPASTSVEFVGIPATAPGAIAAWRTFPVVAS